jgi:DNA-directed RNA polymerase subunit RPC12/RpoP
MINIQHPDITRIERTGHPFVVTEYRYAECAKCGKAIDEEQSAYNLCAKCESEAWERFKYLLLNEFDDNERAYIDACIEGNSLTEIEKIKPVTAVY